MKIFILLLALGLAQAQDCDPADFAYDPTNPSDAFSQECIDAINADLLASFCQTECQGLYDLYVECFGQETADSVFDTACGGFQGDTAPTEPTEEPTEPTEFSGGCGPNDFVFDPLNPTDTFSQECIDAINADLLASFCQAECQGFYDLYVQCFGQELSDEVFASCGGFQGDTTTTVPTEESTEPTEISGDCDPNDIVLDQECIDSITADPVASYCQAECQALYDLYVECFGQGETDAFFAGCGGFQGNTGGPTLPTATVGSPTVATEEPTDPTKDCDAKDFEFDPLQVSDVFNQECTDAIFKDIWRGGTNLVCLAECQELYDSFLECFGQDATDEFFATCGGFQVHMDDDGNTTPNATEEPTEPTEPTEPPEDDNSGSAGTTMSTISLLVLSATCAIVFAKM